MDSNIHRLSYKCSLSLTQFITMTLQMMKSIPCIIFRSFFMRNANEPNKNEKSF